MILDYVASKRAFVLKVERWEADPQEIMREHGLDFSVPDSTPATAVLFTREPYAAVAFWDSATPAAQAQLSGLQEQIDLSWLKESQGHIRIPMDETLAPFQIAGVEYAMRRQNTLIGDVPGLGKTPMAIALANEMRAKNVLVIVPANIRLQWIKNIRRWTTMEYPYIAYPILHGRHGTHPTANWTVVSYDLARTGAIGKALASRYYDLLVLDEAHYAKENDSLRTRAVFGGGENRQFAPLIDRAAATLALTGTPLPNRPREAYTLARGLCFDSIDFMSEDHFRERFNPSMKRTTESGRIFVDERAGRHGELQARLRSNFMVRREKYGPNGVGYQLGLTNMPQYEIVHVEETGEIKKALAAERMLDIDPENWEGADMATLGSIATVRRLMGEAMAPQASEYINMVMNGGEDKVLVFGHHISVLDYLQRALARWGVVRIDGSLSATQKQSRVDDFIANSRAGICLGNMQSMGTGTDGLQDVSHRAIFAEADWVDGTNQQAVDRLDRAGQKTKVLAEFLVAPGSFSEKILAGALRKGKTTHKALDRRM